MRQIEHFIWDFDGTLFDTYPMIIGNLQKALGEFGHTCDPVEAMKLLLENLPTARNYYADLYGIDREELSLAYSRCADEALQQLAGLPMQGVREVLEHICRTGRYNYIFTNRKLEQTVRFLQKYDLDGYFRCNVGAESPCFAYKPAPDAILWLKEQFDMTDQNAVMIGDRLCDLESGRNAGIRTAHYVCAMAPETLVCDWRIETYDAMLQML